MDIRISFWWCCEGTQLSQQETVICFVFVKTKWPHIHWFIWYTICKCILSTWLTCAFKLAPAEFDALLRLGIPDPCSYIKKRFKSNKLLFLRAACVGQTLVDQVEASVEEAVNSATWSDIQVPRQTHTVRGTAVFLAASLPHCPSGCFSKFCPAACP